MGKVSQKQDRSQDPMGRAIADYQKTKTADTLRVFSPMFEEDEMPLQTLFRKYEEMPEIERKALDMARGKVLDVGAGAGCHTLVLQERGVKVTAIDISPRMAEIARNKFPRENVTVLCGDGAIRVTELQAQGGKRMRAPDYFRGHPIRF